MATFTFNFPELLESRQKEIFAMRYSPKRLEKLYPQLFSVSEVRQAHVDRLRLGGVGRFEEKPEGAPIPFTDPVQGVRRRVVVASYANGIRLTHEALADDLWGQLDKLTGDLADSARDYEERLAWDVINDGFTGTTHTGLDNAALFTTHLALRPEVTTGQTNIVSPAVDLNVAGLEQMLTLRRTTQTEEGRFLVHSPATLVIHPDNEWKAVTLLESTGRPGTANNDINTVSSSRNGIKTLIVPYKTSTTNWSLHESKETNSLTWGKREAISFDEMRDADTRDRKYYAFFRSVVYFSEWRGNWGSNFS